MKREYDFSQAERGRFFRGSARLSLPCPADRPDWVGPDGPLGTFVVEEVHKTLKSYRVQPHNVTEHANQEYDTAQGGYAHRQIFELVQNSADALMDALQGSSILVRLTDDYLYCADNGSPLDEKSITSLMFSHMSSKRNTDAIGRFGLGFKSVLRVTDTPEFYSRPISLRFDRTSAEDLIVRKAKVTNAERFPVLRLPEPIEPDRGKNEDEELQELMSWATNIVRLPLRDGARDDLAQQMKSFPAEFLLFVDHVRYLTLENRGVARDIILQDRQGVLHLDTGDGTLRWRRFDANHCLSAEARSGWTLHDQGGKVQISWAAPLDQLNHPGEFWAFFPTQTTSLVAGILNAPWKTNEDRQNVLPGPYNEELIEASARMIADRLYELASDDDPARHLDALPRRQESGDSEQSILLRNHLLCCLRERRVVPDQCGRLRTIEELSYPPKELTDSTLREPFERWAAYQGRPRDWLHHRALRRNRLAAIDRLFPPRWHGDTPGAPRATITAWLEALVKDQKPENAVSASMAAVRAAAAIPGAVRGRNEGLGQIVLTASRDWRWPDPENLFLPASPQTENGTTGTESYVHPDLVSDDSTCSALSNLGLKQPSMKSAFRLLAKRILASGIDQQRDDNLYGEFWRRSRKLTVEDACRLIREYTEPLTSRLRVRTPASEWSRLRVRTLASEWRPINSVLLPGDIVRGDTSRDIYATVDMVFHGPDDELLRVLGATDKPRNGCDLSSEADYESFRDECRRLYSRQENLPHDPDTSYLDFESNKGVGPLQVLTALSDEGRALYTDALLNLNASFERWKVRHTGTNRRFYPKMECESLTIHMLRKHGRIRTSSGIVSLADALGTHPKSSEALRALLVHPKSDSIKAVFELVERDPEFFGEGDPVPLTDVWPGLGRYLPAHRKQCRVICCERILVTDESRACVFHTPDVYLVGTVDDDERHKLRLVVNELGLDLDQAQIESILQHRTPEEVERRRAEVRQCSTDAERLLAAVEEQALRTGLPDSLLHVLENDSIPLTGIEVAKAAIATYHTDALKHYRSALERLDPPGRWAGSERAVDFVRSLGFSERWAGERDRKPDPFLEVEGPYSLPSLHGYQQCIVGKVRAVLRGGQVDGTERRGMISMPTGSGKTRVAVQAIVEAMRDDGFRGGVLWVADREELCEQAVEAWRQVWSASGAATQLRISRMWSGHPRPLPTNDLHVIVATVQTLYARLDRRTSEYEFLADFKLVVFDEAHRSTARTFTTVMKEIGLTRFQKADEPFLLGLTATPYRGHDEEETARLARRYGSVRLDSGAFTSDDPEAVIRQLQDMGVLAHADHETIEGETRPLEEILDGTLAQDELKCKLDEWRRRPWLPARVEERIARSAARTKRIVEAYETYVERDWATLIFATSVEHSQTLAALLNRKGIQSRAVSGTTETATRRQVVDEFRRGKIRALVNYSVFREGFDAPKTRAIIVARPVYSPNLYFQMIGRGLRGPLNGGNERCLILNVSDNIQHFDRKLAFSELDWLWA